MGVAPLWQFVRGDGGSEIVYECRHCGTTVQAGTNVCPVCDSASIAQYRLD